MLWFELYISVRTIARLSQRVWTTTGARGTVNQEIKLFFSELGSKNSSVSSFTGPGSILASMSYAVVCSQFMDAVYVLSITLFFNHYY